MAGLRLSDVPNTRASALAWPRKLSLRCFRIGVRAFGSGVLADCIELGAGTSLGYVWDEVPKFQLPSLGLPATGGFGSGSVLAILSGAIPEG